MEQNQESNLFGLTIDNTSRSHLNEAARWARFLAIVGFVLVGIIAIVAIFGGSYLSRAFSNSGSGTSPFGDAYSSGFTIGIILYYLVIALLIFFAYLFLYRFAVNIKTALNSNEQDILNKGFQNLKILFRYWGILTIIGLCFFAFAFIVAIIIGSSAGF